MRRPPQERPRRKKRPGFQQTLRLVERLSRDDSRKPTKPNDNPDDEPATLSTRTESTWPVGSRFP